MTMLSSLRPRWMRWFRDYSGHQNEGDFELGRKLVFAALDSGQNDKLIVFVAALGFFVDSYILFATNVINPVLGYVYWHDKRDSAHEFAMIATALCGCIFGMLLFGWLGDQYGRRKVYGWELIVLVVGTTGLIMSSAGYVPPYSREASDEAAPDWGTAGSMNVYSWLLWWRFFTSVGIGGDYPLSSVLVSEFAPTQRRSWMLSLVFSMQAVGYATASVVSIIVVTCVKARSGDPLNSTMTAAEISRSVDQIWRWILGVALLPAFAAMMLRLNVPESPRYTLDVKQDTRKAFEEVHRFQNRGSEWANAFEPEESRTPVGTGSLSTRKEVGLTIAQSSQPELSFKHYFFGGDRRWYQRNWTILAGTSLAWFLLDMGFFALSINSPRTLALIWWFDGNGTTMSPTSEIRTYPPWYTDYNHLSNFNMTSADQQIYDILITNNWQSLITNSIGAILGSAVMFVALWRWKFHQKQFLILSFSILTVLLVVTGASFVKIAGTSNHTATVVLYMLCVFFFYFGPNTITFIIPAQLFPTKYRATCAGISAASGKLGSVIIQAFLSYAKFNGRSVSVVSVKDKPSSWFGYALMACAIPMLIGALVAKFWIPDLQNKEGQNFTLEELVDIKERPRQNGVVADVESRVHLN